MSATDNLGGFGPRQMGLDRPLGLVTSNQEAADRLNRGQAAWSHLMPGAAVPSWTPTEEREYRRIEGIRNNLQRRRDGAVLQLATALNLQPASAGVTQAIANAAAIRRALEPFDEEAKNAAGR